MVAVQYEPRLVSSSRLPASTNSLFGNVHQFTSSGRA